MSSTLPPFPGRPGHLPIGTFPAISDVPAGHAAMRQRICELEELCAEVYEAAVVLGLPPHLLSKLWMVAAHGNRPQEFLFESPTEAPLPDVPLTHRVSAPVVAMPELPELLRRRTVMVVDDDPAMLELILKILGSENYELLSADRGDAALEQFEPGAPLPDLLITDLMMPGLNGTELANAMRRRAPSLRVLYQTGFTDSLFKSRQELESGAAFLEKPFTARGLMEAARLTLFGTLNPDGAPAPASAQRRMPWNFLGHIRS